jgi:hypothetical protein
MKHLVGLLAGCTAAAVALGSSNASADILAAATRAQPFESTSAVEVAIPVGNGGGTQLNFTTAAPRTFVKITYNAECVIWGGRGRSVSIRILVDDVEAKPFDAGEFSLCSAVDQYALTEVGATRQAVFSVPTAGSHHVKVVGRAVPSGTWALDDTSLVVEK